MKDLNQLTLISKKEFDKRLLGHDLENQSEINILERLLNQDGKSLCKPLGSNKQAILLVSGGIDSTVLWNYLLENHVIVYPLFVYQRESAGSNDGSLKAVKKISTYLKAKFPDYWREYKIFEEEVIPVNVIREYRSSKPGNFFDYRQITKLFDNHRLWFRLLPNSLYQYPLAGLKYRYYLQYRYNLEVDTILSAILPEDGLTIAGQTLTQIRSHHYLLRSISQDRVDYYSPFFEREFGYWMSKKEVVQLGVKLSTPLEKTWSCTEAAIIPCGTCNSCLNRETLLRQVGYLSPQSMTETSNRLISSFLPHTAFGRGYRKKIHQFIKKITALLTILTQRIDTKIYRFKRLVNRQ